MACVSCKVVVTDVLVELNIPFYNVELGEIDTHQDVTEDEKDILNKKLKKAGLELLEKKQGILIERIRQLMIEYVYNSDGKPDLKFSALLRKELNLSYTYLANFFSEVESRTIEQFMIALKVERVKELLIFGEDTIAEIAYKLNYSSAAHLSTQFKKSTGLTPSHFRNLKERRRIAIQNI